MAFGVCKGECTKYKAPARYAKGSKRCNTCDIFIKWAGAYCPCCNFKLRTGRRHYYKTEPGREIAHKLRDAKRY